MSTRRPTPEDYEALSDSYATTPPRADEVISIEIGPGLPIGRPPKGTPPRGKTPALPVRLPDPIRMELRRRVDRGAAKTESELVRTALVEYFERHPAS